MNDATSRRPQGTPAAAKTRERAKLTRTPFFHRASAAVLRGGMSLVHSLGRERATRMVIRLLRAIGPLLPEQRTARNNIAAAFPEKTEAERAAILAGTWDNFARVIVEFVFLDEVAAEFDPNDISGGRISVTGYDQFLTLRDDGKPAIIVAAHLANWEVLGVVAHQFGLKTVLPFRAPRNMHLAEDVLAQREALMGTLVESGRGASFEIAAALDRGDHLGMLVDQRLNRGGIDVPFMGRPAKTNPLPAKLARHYDCPVHGARAIRRPDGGLHLELTPALVLPRDGEGKIDINGATAAINRLVESWVREHPEQWFWLHDRWRH
ncbi:MAG TPA: lipid A biosynthesis lauroyl acyltransferase [Bauldia sp.]|nr:lipid A biosynthesis lauroyl acyltransferase [Bauldia sp.]